MEIRVGNVNQALAAGLDYLRVAGISEKSRNGPVIVAPEPVTTIYSNPNERVLFSPLRNANPYFHYMEALWMLAGRNDVAWPALFADHIRTFSDDGKTLHGAYGYRWINLFANAYSGDESSNRNMGLNQLEIISEELKNNPDSRRCVLQMWSAPMDLLTAMKGGKDVPCNTHVYFDVRGDVLNMTVCCRSNDIWWGAYGANAVHFSFLLEYMAARVGVKVGVYRQFSNNYHLYPALSGLKDRDVSLFAAARDADRNDAYRDTGMNTIPLVTTDIATWEVELARFMTYPGGSVQFTNYQNACFRDAARMYRSWTNRKAKMSTGIQELSEMEAPDWHVACLEWIDRRKAANAERTKPVLENEAG